MPRIAKDQVQEVKLAPMVPNGQSGIAPEVSLPVAEESPPKVEQIVRTIRDVLVEAPLVDDGPHLDGRYHPRHVQVQLTSTFCKDGPRTLARLLYGLRERGAKMSNGRPVASPSHAVIYLLDQLAAANAS